MPNAQNTPPGRTATRFHSNAILNEHFVGYMLTGGSLRVGLRRPGSGKTNRGHSSGQAYLDQREIVGRTDGLPIR